jgi:ABC-type uncharacterized transport system involved in gliding motility auxiliary subunit
MANNSWMQARQTKFAAYTAVYVLIVFAVIGAINFLANRYNKSADLTANKKFTLSDQTLKVIKDLKGDVVITYWDAPARFQGAHDLLDRYKNLSPKVDVRYEDTDKKRTQAIAAGVKQIPTIFVDVANKHQEAKTLSEEEITGALVRAIKGSERMACFVLGSGEHSIDDMDRTGYSSVKALVEANNYKTQTVKLLEKPEIPQECLIVVVGGPAHDYIQREVDALKKYVEDGGHAIFLLDPPLMFAKQEIDENKALTDMLAAWGVTADKDLALDTSGIGQAVGLGPEVPLVATYSQHAVVRAMKDVASGFPIARSLTIKNGDKTTVEKLFETSDNSFATMNLKSSDIRPSPTDKKGPLTLGAAGTYNGATTGAATGGNGRFIVVGSSRWIDNSFLRFNGNRDLFLNMMNWLSSDEDLISIRPKEPEDRRLTLTARQMALVFYASVLAIPLVILAAGFGVWWRRR